MATVRCPPNEPRAFTAQDNCGHKLEFTRIDAILHERSPLAETALQVLDLDVLAPPAPKDLCLALTFLSERHDFSLLRVSPPGQIQGRLIFTD
jgi:hypothetical protein